MLISNAIFHNITVLLYFSINKCCCFKKNQIFMICLLYTLNVFQRFMFKSISRRRRKTLEYKSNAFPKTSPLLRIFRCFVLRSRTNLHFFLSVTSWQKPSGSWLVFGYIDRP